MITINIGKTQHKFPIKVVDDVVQFPRINTTNKLGKETYWQIFVELRDKKDKKVKIESTYLENGPIPNNLHAVHYVHAGQVDGKLRDYKETKVMKGTNIGKLNETNVLVQAIRNANAFYNKQLTIAKKQDGGIISPMLAEVADEKTVPKCACVQPKLNGTRATVTLKNGEVIMSTRNKKRIVFNHLQVALVDIAKDGIFLDGELYKHGERLQDINGLVNSALTTPSDDDRLQYHIFDMYDGTDKTFKERYKWLQDNIVENEHVKLVETMTVENYSYNDYVELMQEFLDENYEGIMIRKCDSVYQLGRTRDLLKMKPTFDAEFEVVDIEITTKGKSAGAFVFVCKTPAGKTFKVTPKMEIEERQKLVETKKVYDYIGKSITVEYDELSSDNVPLRPRTEGIVRSDI